MTPDRAAEQFLTTFKNIISRDVGQALADVRSGETLTNPFTGQTWGHERKRLHDALAAAGLLDDPQFCKDLATFVVDAATGPFVAMLTLHDRAWLLDDSSEIELRTRGGGPLPQTLHELFSLIEPLGQPETPEW